VATVDGHDFRLGKFNIFVLTDDPTTGFGKAHRIIIDQYVPKTLLDVFLARFGVPSPGMNGRMLRTDTPEEMNIHQAVTS
jgi:hypothetical protein